jgi:hypothetical protein
MNNDELIKLEELVDKFTLEMGEVLNNRPTQVVHMVLARFFVNISMEAFSDKANYMELCSTLWDAMANDTAEETKH